MHAALFDPTLVDVRRITGRPERAVVSIDDDNNNHVSLHMDSLIVQSFIDQLTAAHAALVASESASAPSAGR